MSNTPRARDMSGRGGQAVRFSHATNANGNASPGRATQCPSRIRTRDVPVRQPAWRKVMSRAPYEQHFGLDADPFSMAPDPQYLYMSAQHKEALAHLLYGLGTDGGFVLLT